jgi:CRISPR-associated protein Cmr1
MMQVLEYQMIFTAPAFVGDAEQSGRWRTPPINALFRQWRRTAYAGERQSPATIDAMREKEGYLFGNAWLTNGGK